MYVSGYDFQMTRSHHEGALIRVCRQQTKCIAYIPLAASPLKFYSQIPCVFPDQLEFSPVPISEICGNFISETNFLKISQQKSQIQQISLTGDFSAMKESMVSLVLRQYMRGEKRNREFVLLIRIGKQNVKIIEK